MTPLWGGSVRKALACLSSVLRLSRRRARVRYAAFVIRDSLPHVKCLRRGVSCLVGLMMFLALVGTSDAGAGSVHPPPLNSVNGLLVLFGVDKQAADLVLLVDTSGSMSTPPNAPYPGTLRAYRSFVSAASDSDFLSVVTFDVNADERFNGSLRGPGRALALSALPPVATGASTDIGAALEAALERLSRPDSNDVQILLVLTDGLNDPAQSSVYPRSFGGSTWARLANMAREQTLTHNVNVYGDGLTGIGHTDIGLIKKVFPNATLLGLPSDQLGSFFDEAITRARAEQLRRPVARELAGGRVSVKVVGTSDLGESTTVKVRLHSSYAHLPVSVTLGQVTVTGPNGERFPALSPATGEVISLQPGQDSGVLEVRAAVPYAGRHWYQPSRTDHESLRVSLQGDVAVQPDLLLHRTLGSRLNTHASLQQAAPVTAEATSGLTVIRFAELLGLAALALLVLGLLYRRFLWLPTLTGGLLDLDSERYHPFTGKRLSVPGGNIGAVKTDGGRVEFLTRRGKPGKVYVRRLDDPVAMERYEIPSRLAGEQQVKSLDRVVIGRAKFALSRRGRKSTVGS